MRTYTVSKRERRIIEEKVAKWSSTSRKDLDGLKTCEISEDKAYFIIDTIIAVRVKGEIIPSLTDTKILDVLPKIVVDEGAVRHIFNGADVMRPGIVSFEKSFSEKEIVLVVEENYKRPMAVGLSLVNSDEAQKMEKGVVVKNLHNLGDDISKSIKEVENPSKAQTG